MQVNLEKSTVLERRMKIVVPADQLETQIEEKIRQTASKAQIKGFRPGKVPLGEIRRRFGDGIRQEVGSELMQSSLNEAIVKEEVRPAGMPEIEDIVLDSGKDLEFTAVFEVFPEVELTDLGGIEVEKPVSSVQDTDVDKMIETLRQQRTVFTEVDRPAKLDDKLNIDFEGTIEGEAFDGNKAEAMDLTLGSNSMIPGFEEGLIGSSAGDEKVVSVTFPDDYHEKTVSGKKAEFKVKVHNVKEASLPDLDDEFFTQFGVKEGGQDAFRKEVSSNMEKELENAIKARIKNQVTDALVAMNELEVPKALIKGEIDRLRHDAVHQFGGHGKVDPNMLPAEMFEKKAEKGVKLGLLMRSIMETEELALDDDRVKQTIEGMAASYQEPEQLVNWYYSNEEQLSQVQNMVLEEQLIDFIVDKAKVTEAKMDYDETIKIPQPSENISDESDVAIKSETESESESKD